MPENVQIINPLDYPKWDDLIRSNPNSTFFHSSSWTKVLNESYGYLPLYFSMIDNSRLLSLIPMMEVKSIITGKRGVCLPFTDYCEPILEDNDSFGDPMNKLIKYGEKAEWKYIELRGGSGLCHTSLTSSSYYGHTLALSVDVDKIFSSFRDSTKRNVRKAVREGITVNLCKSRESMEEFYRLNCMTRREHGLPPQPAQFFRKIYEHIISKGSGFIVLASYKKKNIAGAIFFHLGDKALYKYGASDKMYQNLRANNIVMWEAIQWYSRHGFKTLCFGRTEPENNGLMQFKAGWATKERIINYYKYDLRRKAFVKESPMIKGFHNIFFNKMPIPLLKVTGALLYKHMG